ncbi:hypothetical protein JL720_15470 [Aureococcus anophagefferens]|nr:hypothetical protein JL720_15470 [Aureococcus anophagefferens]
MRWIIACLAGASALVVRHPPPARVAAARSAPLDAEQEFLTKVSLVEALRGVLVDGGDVVSSGVVGSVAVSSEALELFLDVPKGLGDADAAACVREVEAAAAGEDEAPEDLAPPANPLESDGYDMGVSANRRGESLRRVKTILAVSSCKGGVGKSTVAVNVALTLAKRGLDVGLADADVHGPSVHVLRRAGRRGAPGAGNGRVRRELLEPFEAHGLKLMSFGYLNDAPAYMRGSRVSGVVQQIVASVAWRDLDVLVVDCPPGTGDAQLTLCQVLDMDAAVVVTTPSRLSFADVVKGVALFDEVDVPVVAVVENLREFALPRADAERDAAAFRRKLVDMWGLETVHGLPLLTEVAQRGDAGEPICAPGVEPSADGAEAVGRFEALVDDVLGELASLDAAGKPAVEFDGDHFVVDHAGALTRLAPAELYARCRCAKCVDEHTGASRNPPPPACGP